MTEGDPQPSRLLPWIRRALFAFSGVGLLLVLGATSLVWPFARDDLHLDRAVRSVALDWRDFGRSKAQARLEYELDHLDIGMQVRDEDCGLFESEEEGLAVRCEWSAVVQVPGTGWSLPLSFGSEARIDPSGSLK